jgi:hypothetical protein
MSPIVGSGEIDVDVRSRIIQPICISAHEARPPSEAYVNRDPTRSKSYQHAEMGGSYPNFTSSPTSMAERRRPGSSGHRVAMRPATVSEALNVTIRVSFEAFIPPRHPTGGPLNGDGLGVSAVKHSGSRNISRCSGSTILEPIESSVSRFPEILVSRTRAATVILASGIGQRFSTQVNHCFCNEVSGPTPALTFTAFTGTRSGNKSIESSG